MKHLKKRKLNKAQHRVNKRQKQDYDKFGESHPVNDSEAAKDIDETELIEDFSHISENSTNIECEQSESSEEEEDTYNLLVNSLGVSNYRTVEAESESEEENTDSEVLPPSSKLPKVSDEVHLNEDEEVESDIEESLNPSTTDNFSSHVEAVFEAEALMNSNNSINESKHWPNLGNFTITSNKTINSCKLKLIKSFQELNMKNIINENLTKSIILNSFEKNTTKLTDFQLELLSILDSYRDLLFTEKNSKNSEQIRFVYTLHALNHVLKTRSRIIHHNAKLNQNESAEYRDQGFVRPKILILLPFRESCFRVVKILISLLFGDKNDESGAKINVMNAKRFMEEFGSNEIKSYHGKPEDYKETFAGNIDDSFRLGISVTKKSLKLYADFYSSDIIIASPLGLRIIIGAKGDKERDYDFLSSIEIFIADQTDIFLMQNWEHILHISKHLNLQPLDSHGVDFTRVRMWYLEGLSKYYRQTLLFSSVNFTLINALFKKEANNFEGQVIVRNPVNPGFDVIRHIVVQCPQMFHRFECNSIKNLPDERFKYFTTKILPQFRDSLKSRTMIYIQSYFDFVRLRNYFRKEELNFTHICEYTKEGKIAQSRSFFFHGGRHFLLYTERAHFFNRFRIKGIRHLIFYELPTFPHFYSELCNLMHIVNQGKKFKGDESSLSCVTLYSKYDLPILCSIVGTERAKLLLKSPTDTHLFVTENKK
ncbi:Digestive organ expansion factor-like protein [Dinothrombium tinctorium]|uniref:U3 small nucleolar RNA-associated protein 25 homolog n=1 Tax=Dinothrombium tinctorium TaxID=1965070 RepID=A0A443RM01_9ACAR|nr:Digestive organ expansion factor-like protein [Dinothrombium tinctorium]